MSSRNAPDNARWKRSPMRSDTSLSESERSFVSAESENASLNAASQSSSTHQPSERSDASSASSTLQQTPLARNHVTTSPSATRKSAITSPPGSYFALQVGTPEPRSPLNRRPPASRSSHGIETRSGPPPALSTRKSYNADLPWGRLASANTSNGQPHHAATNGSIDSALIQTQETPHAKQKSRREETTRPRSMGEMASSRSAFAEDDEEPTIKINERNVQVNRNRSKSTQDRQQEDLFLHLADDTSDTMSRIDRHRYRANTTSKPPRPSTSDRPSSSGGHFPSQRAPSRGSLLPQSPDERPAITSLASLRADLSRDRPYAASAHPLDQRARPRYSGANPSPSFPSLQPENGNHEKLSGRRRSINTSLGKYNSSPLAQRPGSSKEENAEPQIGEDDGTESTVSTTAPSTVWDELDDLKARIRKIELTGNLPTTANSAISNVYRERPITASTTMTNTSISPKRQRPSASPEAPTIHENVPADQHPLLRSALAKAKSNLSGALYRSLETTATDALSLALMTGGKSTRPSSASHATAGAIDRQLRRKADSMCRSLTELCIALAEDRNLPHGQRILPYSGQGSASTVTPKAEATSFSSDVETDPELRASSRVMSRLEARRTSLRVNTAPQSPNSPQSELSPFAQERQSTATKLHKTASVLSRREEDNDSTVSWRPLSRAATDAGSHRPSPQTRQSREYTSQYPLPSPPHRATSRQTSLSTRKPYFSSPATKAPTSPGSKLAGGRNLEGSTPSVTDSNRLAEARQRRLASLGYASPSNTQATSRRVREVGSASG